MLDEYAPQGDIEARHLDAIRELIADHPDCYVRTHFNPGHITGSALLVSHDNTRVLMNHHRALNKWLCFGGHADGERDTLKVALREVVEESGIGAIELAHPGIFDVDVHPIPENPKKGEPAHHHFDIRYLFRVKDARDEIFNISEESLSLRWCDYEEAVALIPTDGGMRRMLDKWQATR